MICNEGKYEKEEEGVDLMDYSDVGCFFSNYTDVRSKCSTDCRISRRVHL